MNRLGGSATEERRDAANQQNQSGGNAPPPSAILMQMLFGGLVQQCIRVAATLGIPDLLTERPHTAGELAAKTGTHEPSLYRVLRTLTSVGIFAENEEQSFELTPVAELLRSDTPNSMRDFAILQGAEWGWRVSLELMHTVRTGETAQEKVHGMSLFEFLTRHRADGELFNRAMTSYSLAAIPAIVEAYDFASIGTLVDLGGGHGSLLSAVLKTNPTIRGVLFELPSVINGADQLLKGAGVRDRVESISGDFFDSVPSGGDAYLMKNVIHDWSDEQSLKILKNIRSAMSPEAKVLIVDLVVPQSNEPGLEKLVDIQMLVTTGGRERTEGEFRQLLAASGLRLTRIIPTRSPMHIVEAVPS